MIGKTSTSTISKTSFKAKQFRPPVVTLHTEKKVEAVAPIVIHEESNNKKDSEKVGEEAREVVVEESGGNPIRLEDVVQK